MDTPRGADRPFRIAAKSGTTWQFQERSDGTTWVDVGPPVTASSPLCALVCAQRDADGSILAVVEGPTPEGGYSREVIIIQLTPSHP